MIFDTKEGFWAMLAVALLGGAAHQAHQVLGGRRLGWLQFLARAVISAFIGLTCYFTMPHDSPWTYAVCGLLSWLGANGVAVLVQMFIRRERK